MKIEGDLHSFHETLLSFKEGDSFSLCYLTSGLTRESVLAVNEAVRLCDVAIVINLGLPLKENHQTLLRRLAVDVLFETDSIRTGELSISLPYNTLPLEKMMNSLLTVMPLVVTSHASDTELIKAITAIKSAYPYLFEFSTAQTPIELMSSAHKDLYNGLETIKTSVQQGETRKEILRCVLSLSIEQSRGVVKGFEFVNKNMEICENLSDATHIQASALFGEKIISDIVEI